MKKLLLLIWFATVTCSAGAQILLSPQVTGTVQAMGGTYNFQVFYSNTHGDTPGITLSQSFTETFWPCYWYVRKGIIEFDADQTANGNPFPPSGMTPYNWTARLNGLSVLNADADNDIIDVRLFDLKDENEDGLVNDLDFNGAFGDPFAQLFSSPPPEGTVYNDIDVTEQLRRDLFGAGSGSVTSGFTLMIVTTLDFMSRDARFNPNSPEIVICMNGQDCSTPTPPPPYSPTPKPSSTPTPTPGELPLRVTLWMPSNHYQPQDPCFCSVTIMNKESGSYQDIKLFVILDVYGTYYYAPLFNEFNYYNMDMNESMKTIKVLEEFSWPNGVGMAADIHWYAAVTNPEMTALMSNFDTWTFGWSE